MNKRLLALLLFIGALLACGEPGPGLGTPTPTPQILYSHTSAGSFDTPAFAVPASWDLNWSCQADSSERLVVTVHKGQEEAVILDVACATPAASGSVPISDAGSISLDIVSRGSWSISVVSKN